MCLKKRKSKTLLYIITQRGRGFSTVGLSGRPTSERLGDRIVAVSLQNTQQQVLVSRVLEDGHYQRVSHVTVDVAI